MSVFHSGRHSTDSCLVLDLLSIYTTSIPRLSMPRSGIIWIGQSCCDCFALVSDNLMRDLSQFHLPHFAAGFQQFDCLDLNHLPIYRTTKASLTR